MNDFWKSRSDLLPQEISDFSRKKFWNANRKHATVLYSNLIRVFIYLNWQIPRERAILPSRSTPHTFTYVYSSYTYMKHLLMQLLQSLGLAYTSHFSRIYFNDRVVYPLHLSGDSGERRRVKKRKTEHHFQFWTFGCDRHATNNFIGSSAYCSHRLSISHLTYTGRAH